MNLLVTGGAGYVGSHCVRELCAAGHDVIVVDNLRFGGHRQAVDPRATLIVADIGDGAAINGVFADRRVDAVLHFAALLDVNESVRVPLRYYENNVSRTAVLLSLMNRYGVRRMVFSSTCATYGIPDSVPIREDAPQRPINPYGRTKLVVEWMLRDSVLAWGLGATALRYFNAAGAAADATLGEDRDPEYHLVPLVLQVALGRRPHVQVFGTDYPTRDGSCVRDYVHVEDLATAHRLVLENQPESCFRAFNVGTGLGTSVLELIDCAREITGHSIPTILGPRREGDPPELYADSGRLSSELGWKPSYQRIHRIVQTAWDWHRTHPNGFDDRGVGSAPPV